MAEQPNTDDMKAALSQVEGMMSFLDGTLPVRQMTGQYRDQLIREERFPEDVANQMAIDFHAMTMGMFRHKLMEAVTGGNANR